MKTQDEEARRAGRSAGEVGLEAVTEESGSVADKRLTNKGFGEDVGDVPGGGDGAEENGEAERAPDQHGIAGGHPAGVFADLLGRDTLGDGLGVGVEGGRENLVQTDAEVVRRAWMHL